MTATVWLHSDAAISRDGLYRYSLRRSWEWAGAIATWVMLNPSTADARVDDATIRRCIGFSREWGCSGLKVVNLYAYRATDPTELRTAPDPVGPLNDRYLRDACWVARTCGWPLIVAWGTNADPIRVKQFLTLLPRGSELHCLGVTKDGHPKHPLRLAAFTPRRLWPTPEGATS